MGYIVTTYLTVMAVHLFSGHMKVGPAIKMGLRFFLTVGLLSYLVMLLFWPWAQTRPLQNPILSLKEMMKFSWHGDVMFWGELVSSDHLPWDYLPTMLFAQMSEVMIVGLSLLLVTAWYIVVRNFSFKHFIRYGTMAYATLFPVAYIVINQSVVYDNSRHVLFVYPFLAFFAAIGLDIALRAAAGKRAYQFALVAIFSGLLLMPVASMIKLHPYQYTYYNHFVGGVSGGYENFERDYWGLSYKELAEQFVAYLEKDESGQSVTVNSWGPYEEFKLLAASHPRISYTDDINAADYVAVLARQNMLSKFSGPDIVRVERYGHTLSVVKDMRASLGSKNQ
jgi:hypothetical protein